MNLLVSIVGPTAVGKTSFAIALARHFNCEIISVDSRQFYRELEIGTAKPGPEELNSVKHHFINSHSIKDDVSAGIYEKQALETLHELFKKHSIVIAVGGSGLYFHALWYGLDEIPKVDESIRQQLVREFKSKGLDDLLNELENSDPEFFEVADRKNPQRVIRALEVIRGTGKPYSSFRVNHSGKNRPFENLKIGLTLDREKLYQRINERMDQMIQAGIFEEASNLSDFRDHNALQTVGYAEIFSYMDGHYDKEEAIRLLKRNSRRYAKRQYTWFNKDPEIVWMDPSEIARAKEFIQKKSGI